MPTILSKSISAFRPAGLLLKLLSFFVLHVLEAQFPKVRKEFQGRIKGLMMCPAISLHKAFNAVEKVMDLVPPL